MPSKIRLKLNIRKLLEEHRILNTVEICRLLNGRDKRDVDWCYKKQGYQITRKRKGFINTKKMRFFDSWGNQTDIFRFWFINSKEFEDKILRQTLIPYLGE
jgi:hypothetical protein